MPDPYLCAVPSCPNVAELFHPDRCVGLCLEHPEWVMAYGLTGIKEATDA